MVSRHAPAFIAHETPNRQHVQAILLLVGYHRLYHIQVVLWLYQLEEWMFCTISIPNREDSVIVKVLGFMDVAIYATVFSIHVHVDGGVDQRMI